MGKDHLKNFQNMSKYVSKTFPKTNLGINPWLIYVRLNIPAASFLSFIESDSTFIMLLVTSIFRFFVSLIIQILFMAVNVGISHTGAVIGSGRGSKRKNTLNKTQNRSLLDFGEWPLAHCFVVFLHQRPRQKTRLPI